MIPVYINNRNRLTTTRELIDWLLRIGLDTITIMDNESTYEPLLEWYKHLPATVSLYHVGLNAGPWVFWERELHKGITDYYIVTDSDMVPSESCPDDVIEKMRYGLDAFPYIGKVGPSLSLDNIPDSFPRKSETIAEQLQYWPPKANRLFPGYVSAPIDTTFALYRPGSAKIDPEPHLCLRTEPPYVFDHVPWTIWPITEEERYVRDHAEKNWSSIAIHTKNNGW